MRYTGYIFLFMGFGTAIGGALVASSSFQWILTGAVMMFLGGTLFVAGLAIVSSTEVPRFTPPPTALCQVCTQPLAWIPGSNRWYCSKCQAWR